MNRSIYRKDHRQIRRVFIRRFGPRVVTAVACAAVVWSGSLMLAHSDYFGIAQVEISQTRHVRSEQVARIFEPVRSQNILTVDLDSYMREASEDRWVEEVRVRKVLPDTLLVHVQERTPAAVVQTNRGMHWVDRSGVVLGPAQDALEELPYITGVALEGLLRQDPLELNRLQTGLDLIGLVQGSWQVRMDSSGRQCDGRRGCSKIASNEPSASAEGGAGRLPSIVLDVSRGKSDPRLHYGNYTVRLGKGNYPAKWRSFLVIQDDLKARGLAPEEIDLRFEGQVIVKTF